MVRNPRKYIDLLKFRLNELDVLGTQYDLCIYNSGMDPYEECMIGGMRGIDFATIEAREATVFEWAKGRKLPVAFVLAGGYTGLSLTQATLVDLHRLTIEGATI